MPSYRFKSSSCCAVSSLALAFTLAGLLLLQVGPRVTSAEDEFQDAQDKFYDDYDGQEEWYDAEEEFAYDEDAGEEVCAGSDAGACGSCCRRQGFDLLLWNKDTSQCECYVSEGDQNVCKAKETKSPDKCAACCQRNRYSLNYFSERSSTCYCSQPDTSFYQRLV